MAAHHIVQPVRIDSTRDVTDDGRVVLGATTRAPDRWTHATAAREPGGRWVLTVLPAHEPDLCAEVTEAVLRAVGLEGGGTVAWWTAPSAPSEASTTDGRDEILASAVGFQCTRELFEMAVPLPLTSHDHLAAVRAMQTGRDEEALLAVNNAAFDWHPDQGGWERDRLDEAFATGDLIADDVLVSEIDGELSGFCWTKVHAHREPPEGEIFVIGVHPQYQGTGLGRGLVLAGLSHLSAVHATPIGMLYVEDTNEAALALYRSLGFEHRRTMRCYELESAPSSS